MTSDNSFNKYDREGAYHHKMMDSDHFYIAKIKKALSLVSSGSVICDIGCGDGVFLKFAEGTGATVYGIDTSAEGVKLAKIYSGCANLCIGSVNNLPLAPSSIDLIVMIDVINYIQDYASAIREASRALKTAGNLVIMSPHNMNIEEEQRTIPDSWQKQACSIENLRVIIEEDLKITEISFIRKPVLAKILQNLIHIFRLLGAFHALRLITLFKHRNAKAESEKKARHFKKGCDIYLEYYNIPKSLIKDYEPLEFIIIAQKNI